MEEVLKKYKENICPFCIHYEDADYKGCNIVKQIDGQAICVNYKCKEYLRRKENVKRFSNFINNNT